MLTPLTIATPADAADIAALRNAVAAGLTARHGIGHWSSQSTERGVQASMKRSSIYIVRDGRGRRRNAPTPHDEARAIDAGTSRRCRGRSICSAWRSIPRRQRSRHRPPLHRRGGGNLQSVAGRLR